MKTASKVQLVLLLVIALGVAAVGPAAAAPMPQATPTPPAAGLTCDDGTCQLTGITTGTLGFLGEEANSVLKQLSFETTADGGAQATLDLQKDIALSLPVGEVTLANARLQVEVGADGKIKRLNGAADMPFPTFGLLDARVVTPARANVGLDLGKHLPGTGFELDPDRTYLFFSANTAPGKDMEVTGRMPGKADQFSLSFAPGQRLTLVIDTVEPVAYLDGHVTIRGIHQVAMLGDGLDRVPVAETLAGALPLHQQAEFGLRGKFSKNLAESQLALSGAFLLDAGMLPAWLGLEAQLLDMRGEVTIDRDGALLDGVLSSAVAPDELFVGGAQVEVFIPFRGEAGSGYVDVHVEVKAPAANLGVEADARAGAGKYELSGQLSTPFTDADLAGKVAGDLPDVAGAAGSAAGAIGSAAGKAADGVKSAAREAAGAVEATAGKAAGAVEATAGKAAGYIGPMAAKASGSVGPAAARAAGALSGYAQYGLELAGNAISAGKAKLSGNTTPAPAPALTPARATQ